MKKREENQRKWKKDNRDESKAGKKTGNLFAVESGEQRIGERRAKKKTKQMMYTRKQREREWRMVEAASISSPEWLLFACLSSIFFHFQPSPLLCLIFSLCYRLIIVANGITT